MSPTHLSFLLQEKNAVMKQFTVFHFQFIHLLYEADRVVDEHFFFTSPISFDMVIVF